MSIGEVHFFAFQFCQSNGGHLAEIRDSDENDEVVRFLNVEDPGAEREFWIGLTDNSTEGVFKWDSNGDLATYTNWDWWTYGFGDQDCVHLRAKRLRRWNDKSCFNPNMFALCQAGTTSDSEQVEVKVYKLKL